MAGEIDLVRARIDLVDLISQRVLLRRTGKNWKGLCPFHDDRNPSFTVSRDTGRYKCWSCGASGDAFTWVMETQKVDFPEALRILAQQSGVTLTERQTGDPGKRSLYEQMMTSALQFFRNALHRSSDALDYCKRRDLSEAMLDEWEIGYAPDVGEALATHLQKGGFPLTTGKELFLIDQDASGGYFDKFRGRLMFPIRDERGGLVAFGGRLLGDGIPKYVNSGDTPIFAKRRVLYGMHRAKDAIAKSRRAVLVEGYLDVIACHRADVTEAVASLGTALGSDHAKLLRRWCEEVVILYDSDAAGQSAAQRAAEILTEEGLRTRIALIPEGKDPDTLLRDGGPVAVQRAASGGVTPLEHRLSQIKEDPSQDAFWKAAIIALAEETNTLDRGRQIVLIADRHPTLRDPEEAQRWLRRQVAAHRRFRRQQLRTGVAVVEPLVRAGLSKVEEAVFLACLDPDLRHQAWPALSEPDLFTTSLGESLASELLSAFPQPPAGVPATWLGVLSEPTQALLGDVGFDTIERVDEAVLQDAIESLRRRRERRSVRALRQDVEGAEDARLHEIGARLRRLSGVAETEVPPRDEFE